VIEELLVEMHLLSVNADFKPDPIYYLGIVTSFERLMQGYQPEKDKEKIFNALCSATDADAQTYKSQAGTLLSLADNKSLDDLIAWLGNPTAEEDTGYIVEPIKAISDNENFKYSRPFGIGIYTLLEECDRELVKNLDRRNESIDAIAKNFNISGEKMKKDLELYRGNLEKMDQLLKVIEDVLEASRKQRAKRAQQNDEPSTDETTETNETTEATAE
jgi:photosystem II biogenesis protein Psp29